MNKSISTTDFEAMVRYAPKLFPGLAQLVAACWGWQRYDTIDELRDETNGSMTSIQGGLEARTWLSLRRKVTAPLDVAKLALELDWLTEHLDEQDEQIERLMVRLGLATEVTRGEDIEVGPYFQLLVEIFRAISDWLDDHDLETPGLIPIDDAA